MIHIDSTSTVVVSDNDKVNRSDRDSDNDRDANVLDTARIVDV